MTASRPITPAQVAALRAIPGIQGLMAALRGTTTLGTRRVNVLAVDPSTFRAFTPRPTAASDALWQVPARGEAIASYELNKRGQGPARRPACAGPGAERADRRAGRVLAARCRRGGRRAQATLVGAATQVVLVSDPSADAATIKAAFTQVLGGRGDGCSCCARRSPRCTASGGENVTADSPIDLRTLYMRAAATCPGLPWGVLAGIGQVETDHGRVKAVSSAGAEGPMQFLPSTWAIYGVDGDGDGKADIFDQADAVYSAARYLCASGGGQTDTLYDAIFAYNHSDYYVRTVLSLAAAVHELRRMSRRGRCDQSEHFVTDRQPVTYSGRMAVGPLEQVRSLPLADTFGRVATDLRISLTDRCNLRCTYCMPAEGLPWIPAPELLTDDELVRLVADRGHAARRRPGPADRRRADAAPRTARPGRADRRARAASGDLADHQRAEPAPARVRRWRPPGSTGSTSASTRLRRERFVQLTRRDRLDDVLRGLEAAAEAGLTPVKVNAVLMRGVNDDEAADLLEFALDAATSCASSSRCRSTRSTAGTGRRWSRRTRSGAGILRPPHARRRAGPGQRAGRDVPGRRRARHRVGIIASVTAPFCANCDRVRLTADGQVRDCLFARTESDLRTPLRSGASDEEIAAALGDRHARQAGRPRHQRPELPAAAAPDVRHRRLTGHRRSYDAVVLAGGGSRRMGGGDKTALALGGVSLLDRVLARRRRCAADDRGRSRRADRRECAGRGRSRRRRSGGGARLRARGWSTAPVVVVLAGDLPFVTAETVGRLLAAGGSVRSGHGRRRGSRCNGCSVAGRPTLLRGALAGDQAGLLAARPACAAAPAKAGAVGGRPEWFDCDEPADFVAAKELLR